jgi:hypothetical protein
MRPMVRASRLEGSVGGATFHVDARVVTLPTSEGCRKKRYSGLGAGGKNNVEPAMAS